MSVLAVIASFLAIFISIILLILGKFIDVLTVPRSFIFFFKLSSNVKDLQVTREELRDKKEDVDKKIVEAERKSGIPTSQVKGWKKDVDDIMPEIEMVINEYNSCGDYRSFSNICSIYSVSMKCAEYHEKLKDLLRRQASFDTVTMESESTNTISTTYGIPKSLEMKYKKVLEFVKNDNSVNIIGVWGMGGVGKTSLLEKIHDYCIGLPIFDHVIWVVASSEQSNISKVQSEIIKKLRLTNDYGDAQSQAHIIHNFLRNKNFLLFIDDLWEAVDLHEVGVPNASAGKCRKTRKVVFTTRQLYVCGNMEAKETVKVECLNWEESWLLFKEKVGEQVIQSHLAISELAKDVAKECEGLPLALITIGRAMSTKRNPDEWKLALNLMRKSHVHEISGTKKNEMQGRLKISYDFLDSEVLKKCFLSISMWPEDEHLRKHDLILWWQGLGIIDNFESMNDAYLMGISLIASLQAACLLEDGANSMYSHDGQYVKMHDVLRDLAIWIASGCGEYKNKWIMKPGIRLHHEHNIALKWSEAECISIMFNHFTELPFGNTGYPNLHTLMLPCNKITCDSILSCFHNFHSLKYLNLYANCLSDFPDSICALAELQYLNLSHNQIEIVPEKLGNLKKLKYLILGGNPIRHVPRGVFSELVKLLKLDLYCNGKDIYRQDLEDLKCLEKKLLCLRVTVWGKELIKLKLLSATNIEALCIWNLQNTSFRFMSLMSNNYNSNLEWCLRELSIAHSHDSLLEIVFHKGEIYDHLHSQSLSMEVLNFNNLSALRSIIWRDLAPKELFANLNDINFTKCSVLEHVSWVIHLPSLESLRIRECNSMRTAINNCDTGDNYDFNSSSLTFPSLKLLHIFEMPNMEKLSTCSLAFPQLRCLAVRACPLLTTVPFELLAYPKIQEIKGELEWWNKLEWKNDDSISHFNQFFRSW